MDAAQVVPETRIMFAIPPYLRSLMFKSSWKLVPIRRVPIRFNAPSSLTLRNGSNIAEEVLEFEALALLILLLLQLLQHLQHPPHVG